VLQKTGKPTGGSKEWTTLAAIIQETSGSGPTDLKIVSMCTGTKCLGKGELSSAGDKLSDSHAEVLTRRAFLAYLYHQINISAKDPMRGSIFTNKHNTQTYTATTTTTNEDSAASSAMTLVLSPGISFHLFISQLPCGDACIFGYATPESDSEGPDCKKPKLGEQMGPAAEANGGNRTGAKVDVGGSYEAQQEEGRCRVKPGKGDPTLSMSCSDKIAKWQMLGESIFIPSQKVKVF